MSEIDRRLIKLHKFCM